MMEGRLLTRAVQKGACAADGGYRTATVRELAQT
jgi:hypothetical protein